MTAGDPAIFDILGGHRPPLQLNNYRGCVITSIM
jgi:hypothetical protein